MKYHNGRKFYTKDKDTASGKCANVKKGGWWYRKCAAFNPNGPYGLNTSNGLHWQITAPNIYYIYPKTFQMVIRPKRIPDSTDNGSPGNE